VTILLFKSSGLRSLQIRRHTELVAKYPQLSTSVLIPP